MEGPAPDGRLTVLQLGVNGRTSAALAAIANTISPVVFSLPDEVYNFMLD